MTQKTVNIDIEGTDLIVMAFIIMTGLVAILGDWSSKDTCPDPSAHYTINPEH